MVDQSIFKVVTYSSTSTSLHLSGRQATVQVNTRVTIICTSAPHLFHHIGHLIFVDMWYFSFVTFSMMVNIISSTECPGKLKWYPVVLYTTLFLAYPMSNGLVRRG